MSNRFDNGVPASAADVLLPFVQLEFSHDLGVPAGAYVVLDRAADRAGAPELGEADSLLVEIVDASPAATRRRSVPSVPGSPPRPVPLVVATLVLATRALHGEPAAARLLAGWRDDASLQNDLRERALMVVNRGIRAYRLAAVDPYAIEVMEADPRAVRFGYGRPGQTGAGSWVDAFEIEARAQLTRRRKEEMRIGETVGASLAGQPVLFEAEELAQRSLLDLRYGRRRAAAAQARAAVEVLKLELRPLVPAGTDLDAIEAHDGNDPAIVEATAVHVLETAAAYRAHLLRAGSELIAER